MSEAVTGGATPGPRDRRVLAAEFEGFAFTPENEAEARRIVAKYPPGRQASAILDLLRLAQDQVGGWLPPPVVSYVARFLDMPEIRAYEVATFYDMYNTKPVGRTQIRVCTTTPCWLCGSDAVVAACEGALGIRLGESTPDGRFFLRDFECLGACANAPMMWIDDDYYEDLDGESATAIIEALKRGERPTPGSQRGRRASMPIGGRTTLHELPEDVEREEGPVEPATEPVEKGRPEREIKEHAVRVEEEGRPADKAGEEPEGPDVTGDREA